jgi:hypothetical protein
MQIVLGSHTLFLPFPHIEPDSDPEFNPGTFIYETTKRGKRKTTAGRDASPSSLRKRRSDVLRIESISRSRDFLTPLENFTADDDFREPPTNGPGGV